MLRSSSGDATEGDGPSFAEGVAVNTGAVPVCPAAGCRHAGRAGLVFSRSASVARRSRLVLEPDGARHMSKTRVIWRRPDCLKLSPSDGAVSPPTSPSADTAT